MLALLIIAINTDNIRVSFQYICDVIKLLNQTEKLTAYIKLKDQKAENQRSASEKFLLLNHQNRILNYFILR